MATPDEKNQQADSNPVIENKAGKTGKGKMKKIWIFIAAFIVLTAGGLTIGLSYFKGARLVFEQQDEASGHENEAQSAEKPKSVKATYALEPFLVNLADKNNVRFVKTSFKLGLEEEPEEEQIEMAVAAMRDSIITLLSSKTSEQIMSPQGKDILREQVRTRVNAVSPEIKVLEVYIVDFVVQL